MREKFELSTEKTAQSRMTKKDKFKTISVSWVYHDGQDIMKDAKSVSLSIAIYP